MANDETKVAADDRVTALMGGDGRSNPTPANEEGPHLDDPDNRALKRKQLREAGVRKGASKTGNMELSDTLQAILQEDE